MCMGNFTRMCLELLAISMSSKCPTEVTVVTRASGYSSADIHIETPIFGVIGVASEIGIGRPIRTKMVGTWCV